MTWSVSASGKREDVHAQVREQVKAHTRIAAAICELVDCTAGDTLSVSGSGSEGGTAGGVSLSITGTAAVVATNEPAPAA